MGGYDKEKFQYGLYGTVRISADGTESTQMKNDDLSDAFRLDATANYLNRPVTPALNRPFSPDFGPPVTVPDIDIDVKVVDIEAKSRELPMTPALAKLMDALTVKKVYGRLVDKYPLSRVMLELFDDMTNDSEEQWLYPNEEFVLAGWSPRYESGGALSAPYDGSQYKRRYWRKVRFADET